MMGFGKISLTVMMVFVLAASIVGVLSGRYGLLTSWIMCSMVLAATLAVTLLITPIPLTEWMLKSVFVCVGYNLGLVLGMYIPARRQITANAR